MRLRTGAPDKRLLIIEDGLPPILAPMEGATVADCEAASLAYSQRLSETYPRLSSRITLSAFDLLIREARLAAYRRSDGGWVSRPPAPGVDAARTRLHAPPRQSRPGMPTPIQEATAPF